MVQLKANGDPQFMAQQGLYSWLHLDALDVGLDKCKQTMHSNSTLQLINIEFIILASRWRDQQKLTIKMQHLTRAHTYRGYVPVPYGPYVRHEIMPGCNALHVDVGLVPQ